MQIAPTAAEAEKSANVSSGRSRLLTALGLTAILAVALAFRLYGINWDQGGLFHPDERAVLMHTNDLRWPAPSEAGKLFSAEESPLNPHWFNYGTLPMYALKAVQSVGNQFASDGAVDLFDLRIPARAISAIADTITVAFVFFLATRLYGRRTGFIAAALSALTVIQIQLAHFYAFDSVMTTFIVAGVFFSVRVAQEGRVRDSVLTGLMLGLGLATKFSVAPLVLTVVFAHAIYAFSKPREALTFAGALAKDNAPRQWQAYKRLAIAAAVAVVSVLLTQPYMLIDRATFMSNVNEQSEMVRRILDYPYTRQYLDTPKYFYQGWQLGVFGLGPVAGMLAWSGFFIGLVVAALTRRKAELVVLSWLVPYLLITGWFEVKFMRYMLPAAPFLVIYAARLLVWLGGGLTWLWPKRQLLLYVPAVIALALTAHYALAFASMYGAKHPAQQVHDYLAANAGAFDEVLQEHWEEGIPNVPNLFYPERLGLYDDDTQRKFELIATEMAHSEYFVIYSNRLYATLPRIPERYPLSTKFYTALFDGSLGYELVFVGQKERSFLGVTYRDDPFARITPEVMPPAAADWQRPTGELATLDLGWADESFTVYEHPVSFVFRNTKAMTEVGILLEIGGLEVQPGPATGRVLGLQLTPEDAAIQQAGGTWNAIFFARGLPDGLSPVVWFIAAQLMAFAALPLAFSVFKVLPDRGYLLAKPLGILLAAVVAWLLASLRWLDFSWVSVLVGILAVGLVSAVALRFNRRELSAFFKRRLTFVLVCEALFLGAFLAFLFIRMANPDLWHPYRGGEKPMDLAYLTAVTRSTLMPPYDPWFAGGYLNYYYFGQFIVASLIRLTGIEVQVAYNLAVPLMFALTAAAAFSVVYNLAELTQRARGHAAGVSKSPVIAGILAVGLVAVVGNLDGLWQFWQNTFGEAAAFNSPFNYDFWRSSRMMPPDPPGHEITEFPFFTFLFADLHAHLMAIPFLILAVGLAVAVFVRAGQSRPLLEGWAALALLGVVTGALRVINTWDFPTALAISVALIGFGELFAKPFRPVRAVVLTGVKTLAVLAVGYVVFLPFHRNFELFNNGFIRSLTITEAWRYASIHGLFLVAITSWVFFELKSAGGWRTLRDWLTSGGIGRDWVTVGAIALATLPVALVASRLGTVGLIAAMVTLVVLAAASVFARVQAHWRYAMAAASFSVVALLIGAAVDLLTVKGDIDRMNTVFKFYLHAWVLFGLSSAYFLWLMWSDGRFSFKTFSPLRTVWMAALIVLVFGVFVFPVLGTRARVADRFDNGFTGLDGMDYMDVSRQSEKDIAIELSYDREGIEWLRANVKGSPVVVEGLTDQYHWGGRISVYTGLPAVIGWDWHQRQQRVNYDWAVTERRAEVNHFYETDSVDAALYLIGRYNVKYVYVGQLESIYYPAEGLAKFALMADRGLKAVYQNDKVTIYEYTGA